MHDFDASRLAFLSICPGTSLVGGSNAYAIAPITRIVNLLAGFVTRHLPRPSASPARRRRSRPTPRSATPAQMACRHGGTNSRRCSPRPASGDRCASTQAQRSLPWLCASSCARSHAAGLMPQRPQRRPDPPGGASAFNEVLKSPRFIQPFRRSPVPAAPRTASRCGRRSRDSSCSSARAPVRPAPPAPEPA